MLRSSVTVDFKEEDPEVVGCVVQFMYRSNYDIETLGGDGGDLGSAPSQPYERHLILHAKVYALAEKYVVEGLKALNLAKFETACDAQQFNSGDFLSAAEFAYASTIEADRGMRNAIVKAFYQHPGYLDSDTGRATLQTVHGLSYDILQHVRAETRTHSSTADWRWM